MKKIMIFNLIILIAISFVLVGCANTNAPTKSSVIENSNPQQLRILKTNNQLTQDQRLSQIKAKTLIENNGYDGDDEVVVIMSINHKSLAEKYTSDESSNYSSLSEYIQSPAGQKYSSYLKARQDELIGELNEDGLINGVEYQYVAAANAISCRIYYKNLSKLEAMSTFSYVALSDTYNQVQSTEGGSSQSMVENVVDVYSTGIFNSSSVSYTGEGTAVAILDSGFDVSHEVFLHQPETELISTEKIDSVLNALNAKQSSSDLKTTDVYYSKKIPYMYDYADKDPDVAPFDSSHGTHVAGIIGGSSDTITGVAVNTQLVLMKVFADKDSGAETEDILAALEDAIILGVDCINMSLGTTCGFSREVDEENINLVYDAVAAAGITCMVAASNDHSSGFQGPTGDTALVTHPDSGTIGSPGSYDSTLTVASISGVKSRYAIANDNYSFFYLESNDINGNQNSFIDELYASLEKSGDLSKYMDEKGNVTLEYVTVPGIGSNVNYSGIDVKGKIALIRRGSNTFEEKAAVAKAYGAIACIIYNNVDGDIYMSMGKTDHIPCVSLSKDDGTVLAKNENGTISFNMEYQAGPFMSDFSSWGPTPDLRLKPEITGHGGSILSSVPGGGYEEMSGTSMACPNLCGITVLIRQYIKEKYASEISSGAMNMIDVNRLANQLLMSTATIAKDTQGNSYSPRKQGAGLASLKKATTTNAYISIQGSDKTKIELYDDKDRSGSYTMEFIVNNISSHAITYTLGVDGLTETVSTSDYTHLAERATNLNGTVTINSVSGGTYSGYDITVPENGKATVSITYTIPDSDKEYMDANFPYGIYVEGFVTLEAIDANEVSINCPFLAFYGDWTQAAIFDKTFFDVESESHDDSIDDEDKIREDYYATTPFASYLYAYVISLGTYIYEMDPKYDYIPASKEHIAISSEFGTLDGIASVYTGLLRGCKSMTYSITDNVTGERIYELIDYNARKSASSSGTKVPYNELLGIKASEMNMVNNRTYTFRMQGMLDYGDGGVESNINNSFEFTFTFDNEAPLIKSCEYETVYDKSLKKNRYYITLTVYDNHYVQSITPLTFTSNDSYSILTAHPIPVYGEKGSDTKVKFEVTDYLDDLTFDELISSGLSFQVDDYALNSTIYLVQLPGTNGEFKFTKDGTDTASKLSGLEVTLGEVVDLTQYLYSTDETLQDKYYLSLLNWTSSNTNIVEVKNGTIIAKKAGKATITVYDGVNVNSAELLIDVVEEEKDVSTQSDDDDSKAMYADSTVNDIRFVYFDTIYAHKEGAQKSAIGKTGQRLYVNAIDENGLNFYPGEIIKLKYDFDPWYAEGNYTVAWSSTNESVASVDQDGTVKGLKKGSTTITCGVNGSNIKARIYITINSEFVIESKTLVAYKGLGGAVVIPDDEGITQIAAFAFALYETDKEAYVDKEDYDANKVPGTNDTVTSVIIPEGVTDIQKYAFYGCTALESITFADSVKNIYNYAFTGCVSLNNIEFNKVLVIGQHAFEGCTSLENANLSKVYAIGEKGFFNCTSLKKADLTSLRNTGEYAFGNTTSLSELIINKDTKISKNMFVNSSIETLVLDIDRIPSGAFRNCTNLKSVTFTNDLVYVGSSAFEGCTSLENVEFEKTCSRIEQKAFKNCTGLTTFTLPNNEFSLYDEAFLNSSSLKTLVFKENTLIKEFGRSVFFGTSLTSFDTIDSKYYENNTDLLVGKSDGIIYLASSSLSTISITGDYKGIYASAFTGCKDLEIVTIDASNGFIIGNSAFEGLSKLKSISLKNVSSIGDYAFYNTGIVEANGIDTVSYMGAHSFENTNITALEIKEGATIGDGAFENTKLESILLNDSINLGKGVFRNNSKLIKVEFSPNARLTLSGNDFENCVKLTSFDFASLNNVGDYSFRNCVGLETLNLTNATTIGDYAFINCPNITFISISSVKAIGNYAFSRSDKTQSATKITGIDLSGVEKIGEGAFKDCEKLLSVSLPLLTKVEKSAFEGCVSLAKVTLGDDVETIGDYAFKDCTSLEEINLGSVITINDYAFNNASKLTSISLDSATYIGQYAFKGLKLESLGDTSNIETIREFAFFGNRITSFDASSLEYIYEGAFWGCNFLREFQFSNNIRYVGKQAFYNCDRIEKFTYNGLVNAKVNDYAFIEKGCLYTYLENGKVELKSIPAKLNASTLSINSDTYRIDAYAGNQNSYITSIVLPDNLKVIGVGAFYKCKNLTQVEFKSFTAPTLENEYNESFTLEETDPGYDKLHSVYHFFSDTYTYINFVDLLGKKEPIKMIVPSNDGIIGYDSIIYEVYFGNGIKSDYVARDQYSIKYLDLICQVPSVDELTFRDQQIVLDTLTAYNALRQDLREWGYTDEQLTTWKENLLLCKEKIQELKLEYSSLNVQKIQSKMNDLGTEFTIDKLDDLYTLSEMISNLSRDDKEILDYTSYNKLKESYKLYQNTLKVEANEAERTANNLFNVSVIAALSATLASSLLVIAFRRKRRTL